MSVKSIAQYSKKLKGLSDLTSQFDVTSSSLLNILYGGSSGGLSSGSLSLSNVFLTSSIIENTPIGTSSPSSVSTTSLTVGTSGTGYPVLFYSNIVGDYLEWDPNTGTLSIQGNFVSQITNLGNLQVSGNTIEATNTNGDIILQPQGTGHIDLSGSIQQTQLSSVSFNQTTQFSVNAQSIVLTSNNGGSNASFTIIDIQQTGTILNLTTLTSHNFSVGSLVSITNTMTIPTIDGRYIIQSVPSSTTFSVLYFLSLQTRNSTGTVSLTASGDISLDASGTIYIPLDTPLNFGTSSQISGSNGILYIDSPEIILHDPIPNLQSLNLAITDLGISMNYNDNNTAFFGMKATSGHLVWIPDALVTYNNGNTKTVTGNLGTIEVDTILGNYLNVANLSGPLNANGNTVTIQDLQVTGGNIDGTPIGQTVPAPGNFTNITTTGLIYDSFERITISDNIMQNVSNAVKISLISVTYNSQANLDLPNGTMDGQMKIIVISNLSFNTSTVFLNLSILAPELDPTLPPPSVTGILFDSPGQGVHLLWDNVLQNWIIINGGGTIT